MTQEKSTQNFTRRLERLKFSREWTDEQLADEIGVSRRMLWLNRTGKKPISAKTLWKLQQQESLSTNPSPDISPLQPSPQPTPLIVKETPPSYGKENISIVERLDKLDSMATDLANEIRALRKELNLAKGKV